MNIIMSLGLYPLAIFGGALGVLVYLRNPQSPRHRLFLGVSLANALWILSNAIYGMVASDQIAYFIALASYAFAAAMAVLFVYFVAHMTGYDIKDRRLIPLEVLLVVLSAMPQGLATGVVNKNIITTPLIFLYAAVIGITFIIGTIMLVRGLTHRRGQQRQQIAAIFIGIMGSSIGGIIFNLMLPLQNNYKFVQLGPAFSMVFIVASAYAIVRQRLFDLRAAVVRVAAYSLSVVSVAALYVAGTFVIAVPLFGAVQTSLGTQLSYIGLAILAALTFQPVKKFFDKATRAVFYKNAYITQHVLDELGTLLVREVDVRRLSKHSLQILANAIKPSTAQMVVLKNHTPTHDIILNNRPIKDAHQLIVALRARHQGLVVTDDLAIQGGTLHQLLVVSDVAIATPLVTSNATVGYLLIGYKASGDAFTQQDIDLVRIFADELAVAVQNALRFEEISRFNVTLKEEVDDATSQLRDSNRKLHRLDEAKDEFISMASHQLRTPLTSVKGYLSMVLEGDVGNITEEQRKLLQEAYGSAQRMVYLIGDFLNVSRLQTGKFMLEIVPVNLAHVVQDEVEQLQATAARRQIRLEYHQPANFPDLAIDDGKIRQVVMNFIDNAIYYSRPNSTVLVELTLGVKEVTLAVHDTGIGVPVSERHHLFTKFYRASNARRVRPDGTGIGLYMAKKVVTAHGGSIIFETKENKGSTFGFKLPLKKAD